MFRETRVEPGPGCLSPVGGWAIASADVSMTVEDSVAVLSDLRRARRKQRVAEIHWIDAFYQVYVTGLVVGGRRRAAVGTSSATRS